MQLCGVIERIGWYHVRDRSRDSNGAVADATAESAAQPDEMGRRLRNAKFGGASLLRLHDDLHIVS
jgi:hypothetical protein